MKTHRFLELEQGCALEVSRGETSAWLELGLAPPLLHQPYVSVYF